MPKEFFSFANRWLSPESAFGLMRGRPPLTHRMVLAVIRCIFVSGFQWKTCHWRWTAVCGRAAEACTGGRHWVYGILLDHIRRGNVAPRRELWQSASNLTLVYRFADSYVGLGEWIRMSSSSASLRLLLATAIVVWGTFVRISENRKLR
jgi:hypothetical protein